MKGGRASVTAYRVAVSRAAHQVFDRPCLLNDRFALPILGARPARALQAHGARFATTYSRHLRAFVVARSKVAEDALAAAVARGVRRYVVLGAGLDTFAYRNPYVAERLRVFEVDHAATQAWKRELLESAGIAIPDSVAFVPVDFETESLADRLARAGLEADAPVFFSWLGVSMYLTRDAFLATIRFVATRARGSGVTFDYAAPPTALPVPLRLYFKFRMRSLAAIGEPWRTFLAPAELAAELEAAGFAHVEPLSPDAINLRFYSDRADRLRVGGVGHVMTAWV